jgi:hypothetical protein
MKSRKKSPVRKARSTKRPMLHVAVVVSRDIPARLADMNLIMSRRTKGDWAAFMGFDLVQVVEQARRAMDEWNVDGPGSPYEILVGNLDFRATFPVEFTLKPLSGGSK